MNAIVFLAGFASGFTACWFYLRHKRNRREWILAEALAHLYQNTADYITINHLGDTHHNQSMQKAKAALEL